MRSRTKSCATSPSPTKCSGGNVEVKKSVNGVGGGGGTAIYVSSFSCACKNSACCCNLLKFKQSIVEQFFWKNSVKTSPQKSDPQHMACGNGNGSAVDMRNGHLSEEEAGDGPPTKKPKLTDNEDGEVTEEEQSVPEPPPLERTSQNVLKASTSFGVNNFNNDCYDWGEEYDSYTDEEDEDYFCKLCYRHYATARGFDAHLRRHPCCHVCGKLMVLEETEIDPSLSLFQLLRNEQEKESLVDICEVCKEVQRRALALARGASETIVRPEVEEDDEEEDSELYDSELDEEEEEEECEEEDDGETCDSELEEEEEEYEDEEDGELYDSELEEEMDEEEEEVGEEETCSEEEDLDEEEMEEEEELEEEEDFTCSENNSSEGDEPEPGKVCAKKVVMQRKSAKKP